MGTGPWPQPPTEAEQLQALMAAANGESCTSSLSSTFSHQYIFCPNLFIYFPKPWRGCAWAACLFGLLLEGNEPDWLIDSLCVQIDFSMWRLSRGRLGSYPGSGHSSPQFFK